MPSQTKENYLKALYFLADENDEISLTELSKEMGVSIPTVNSMVKKLQENQWVIYQKYKPLKLTTQGRKSAALIIRKHRLTEMYLVEKMGFGWEEVHDIAEEMEHINSVTLFDRMDEILGHPTVDPHGSPIPDKNGSIADQSYIKLSDCTEGSKVILRALADSSVDFLLYLNRKGLELGITLDLLKVEPFDHSMTVAYGGEEAVMLSHEVSNRLMVEAIKL